MTDWIERTVESLGYLGVALLMFLENVFPPIPSEIIMPLAGFASSRGELTLTPTVLAGAAGSLAGTSLFYLAGRAIEEQTLISWVRKHGRWIAVDEKDIENAKDWFGRHGRWALLVCRFVPGVRTLISLPAGLCRTSIRTFLAYSTAGVLIWTAALAYAGAALGKNYDQVNAYVGPVSWVVFGAVLTGLAMLVYRRRTSHSHS